jgi:RNA polymerase sigma factor (sigma-70 family)
VDQNKDKLLADLFALHGDALEHFLARKLGNPDDAAEVAQETFLRLHRLEQLENLDNARAFLFQVASNIAIDHLRRRQLHFRYLKTEKGQQVEGEPADLNASGASPEEIIGARERLETLYRAVDELPFKVRQAFLLHRRGGMSYSDIAEQMEVSVSSVEKYILQALRHCRDKLAGTSPASGKKSSKK